MTYLKLTFKHLVFALPGLLLFVAFLVLGALLSPLLANYFPAVIVGMFIFLACLLVYLRLTKSIPVFVKRASDFFLPLLPLFILPSCIGILNHYDLLVHDGWLIFISLLIGIVLTQMITPLVFRIALKLFPEKA